MAAPVTDPVLLRVLPGPTFLSQLREGMTSAPNAPRFLVGGDAVPPEALSTPEPVIAVGVPVSDTCKEVVDGLVRRTVPRESLVDLTGPWLFSRAALAEALGHLAAASAQDPLALCRVAGLRIRLVLAR